MCSEPARMCIRLQLIKQTIKTIIKHLANVLNQFKISRGSPILLSLQKDYIMTKFETTKRTEN